MKKIRVGLIFGGRSGEHEVSLISAQSILNALDKGRFEPVPIYIDKKGSWQLGLEPKKLIDKQTKHVFLPPDPSTNKLISVKDKEPSAIIDVVFPVLHGTYGEDGAIQGLLELANIPYVGCSIASSAVGLDKDLMKKIFTSVGLPVTKYQVILRKEVEKDSKNVIERIEGEMKYPLFTKPANLGSSVGISKVKNRQELISGLRLAAGYDRKIIIEEAVKNAREIEVAVLGNDTVQTSICGEVTPSKEFYDYEDKYILDKAKLEIPAKIPVQTSQKIKKMAESAFKAIDGSGMARVDFLLDGSSSNIYIQEVNTIPGFTSISMYPKLWEASGISYSELIGKLIDLAFDRYNDKKQNKTSFPTKLLK